jgi:hypothetical protein
VLTAAEGDAIDVVYETVEIADMVAANVNKVVTLKGATYTAFKKSGNDRSFTITKGNATIPGWNAFGLADTEASEQGKTYDIIGAISIKNSDIQFQPIEIKEATSTNISTIKANTDVNAPVYNLAGQQVEKSYKGLVIKNGKKVINK